MTSMGEVWLATQIPPPSARYSLQIQQEKYLRNRKTYWNIYSLKYTKENILEMTKYTEIYIP